MRSSLSIILLLGILMSGFSQSQKDLLVNGKFDNVSLEVIFDQLSNQIDFFFSYNPALLPKGSLYTIEAEDMPIDQFLSKLLIGTGLKYSFYKDQIILNYEAPEEIQTRKKNYFTITGKVVDEKGNPLQHTNVFLDGTTIGTSTDLDGNYQLEGIPPGYYDIVFSFIGFENAVYQINEKNGGARIQNHKMELDMGQLEEVEVVSDRIRRSESSWLTHYTTFKKELLGKSQNAEQCVIENPEALNFNFTQRDASLLAYSKEPIQIRNDALGYRISYILESFSKKNSDLRFRGKIRFKNLEPINAQEKRTWNRNRKLSYRGSFNHFKKALLNGRAKEEGFRLYLVKSLNKLELTPENQVNDLDIIVFKGNHYQLDFKHFLVIEYRKEKESKRFLSQSEAVNILYKDLINDQGMLVKNPGNQLSIIKLLRGPIRLDLSGQVLDRFGISTYGYWSWERTADFVPINYDPKFDKL